MRLSVIKSVGIRNTCDLIARIALPGAAIATALSACSDQPEATPTSHLATTPTPSVAEIPAPESATNGILDPTPVPTIAYTPTVVLPATPTPTSITIAATASDPAQTPTTTPTSALTHTPAAPPTPESPTTQRQVLIDPEVITGGYHIGVETLWPEVLSIVPLSEDERSCVLRTFAPDVEGSMDRTFWPELPEEQDVEALGCLAPETFANIYLSLIITVIPLNDEHVKCLRGLFSVTDFSVIIAAMLPEGYDANEVEVEGFWDGFLGCVPEELLNEASDNPTPTPVPSPVPPPEPTPTRTPVASPTSVSIPTPAQSCGLAVPDQSANPDLMRDCNTLLAAKDTLRGSATLNWSVDVPIADWDGVWVQGTPGRVTGLVLTSKSLTGTIPPDLGRLDALEHLRLDENRLTGELPAELGGLRDLRSLLLNDNQLTGEVSAEIGNLHNLWHLQLGNNQLTGCVPPILRKVDTNDLRDLRLKDCVLFDDAPVTAKSEGRSSDDGCLDRYDIRSVGGGTVWMSPSPDIGEGVLEQRVLENDVVVVGQVLRVNPEVVTVDSVKSKFLKPSIYEGFQRTLIVEVHVLVSEYLKGNGPGEITAVVEGQSVFNTEEEGVCASAVFEHKYGRLIETGPAIAFLTATRHPGSYNLGYADEIIAGSQWDHGTWLVGEHGMFYDATRDRWIGLDEARQKVSSVVEEHDRRDDQRWRDCVYYKYRNKGRDPWRYRGGPITDDDNRDHDIIFNGERVPVDAGTTIWSYADYYGLTSESRLWLRGTDAGLFEVAYHSRYEITHNEWRAASGGDDQRLAIWHLAPEGSVEKWQQTVSGFVITAVEDLPEGVYEFYLFVEDQSEDHVDCGQAHPEPNRFRVFVDGDKATVPPAPTNVEIFDDAEGWTIVWDPEDGVDDYYVYVYRLEDDGEERGAYLGDETEDPGYRIRFDELNGCDDLIYVRITPEGDGETYLKDFGASAGPIELRTDPCG